MRRPLRILLSAVPAVALLASAALAATSPASAAPIAGAPTTYCGDPDTDPSMDTGAGTMISCDTLVANTITGIDPATGTAVGTSVVTVTECTGPASGRLDPSFLTCSTDVQNLANLVTRVDQCNGVGYGGGNVLECTVDVRNTFVGVTPAAGSAATVNQCNGSAPDTTGCNPYPASTTNATITQCNNSSYGGGQEDFICTATGTTTASLEVTVNQCNDSNYGGGSWLTCTADLGNTVAAGAPTPTLTPSSSPATPSSPAIPSASPGLPDTSVTGPSSAALSGPLFGVVVAFMSLATLGAWSALRRGRIGSI